MQNVDPTRIELSPTTAREPACCTQCGERLAPERDRSDDRTLCVDCAFDTVPCTD